MRGDRRRVGNAPRATLTPALRSRNADYYEKIAEPLDLSTIEKQLLTGYYKTVEAFDADMLKVFRNAEVAPGVSADRARLRPAARSYPLRPWSFQGALSLRVAAG